MMEHEILGNRRGTTTSFIFYRLTFAAWPLEGGCAAVNRFPAGAPSGTPADNHERGISQTRHGHVSPTLPSSALPVWCHTCQDGSSAAIGTIDMTGIVD